jgi:hypothetical protein
LTMINHRATSPRSASAVSTIFQPRNGVRSEKRELSVRAKKDRRKIVQ